MKKHSLTSLKGISYKRAEDLAKLSITSLAELITFFPKSYQDYSHINTLDQVFEKPQERLLVKVRITSSRRISTKRGVPMYQMVIQDNTATGYLLSFGYKGQYLKADPFKYYLITGIFKYNYGKIECSNFNVEGMVEDSNLEIEQVKNFTQIMPFYQLTAGITQKMIRSFIKQALQILTPQLEENLPPYIVHKYKFLSRVNTLKQIHFPTDFKSLSLAKQRLKYTELFRIQFQFALKKRYFKIEKPQKYKSLFEKTITLQKELPFILTQDQLQALEDIQKDLLSTKAMHRLIMGDVGSGKTIVAFLSMLKVVESGYQSVFLAPTEVLAKQHYKTISKLVSLLEFKIEILTGSTKIKQRKLILDSLKNGDTQILIGTHAVFSSDVFFKNLGLAIIDEQHKFGVKQRMELIQKGSSPDVLVMSATPIPRTLGFISFGDMDISFIKNKPVGRIPIQTDWLEEADIQTAYNAMKEEIKKGHQGYIIYPLVNENEKTDTKSAIEGYHYLTQHVFPEYHLTLLHGQMSEEEKTQSLKDFYTQKSHILVSTMIIEVGVDVPNATCMIIENATRFGLSTLHQLRGRIGRNSLPSTCYVVSAPKSSLTFEARERMKIIKEYNDGFILAEKDMELRGVGNLLGKNQSGHSGLKLANILTDQTLLEQARTDAFTIIKNDPECLKKENIFFKSWIKKFEEEIQALLHN